MADSPSSKSAVERTKIERFELIETVDEKRFKVTKESDILQILTVLHQKSLFLTVYSGSSERSFLTVIFIVDEAKQEIIFDAPGDSILTRQFSSEPKLILATAIDRVRVQFELTDVRQTVYQNNPAFVASFPKEITRLQRRDFYRLTVPIITPVECELVLDDSENLVPQRFGAYDISLGGIGINDLPLLPTGRRINGVRIEIPEEEPFEADLVICHNFSLRLRNGKRLLRTGCRYVTSSADRDQVIQRYINKITMERRMRENRHDPVSWHSYEDRVAKG